jgi:hypothetical protein
LDFIFAKVIKVDHDATIPYIIPMRVERMTTREMYAVARFDPIILQMTIIFGRLMDGPARRRARAGPGAIAPEE